MATNQEVGTVVGSGVSGASSGAAVGGPWGAVIGGAAGIVVGLIQAGANDKAIAAQTNLTEESIALQRQQWEQQQAQQAPWLAAGNTALAEMLKLAGSKKGSYDVTTDPGYKPINTLTDPGKFQFNTSGPNADPSYAWRLNQGLSAVNSSQAAKGGYFGGNTATALNDYAQGAASTEYQNQYNRYQSTLADYMNQETFNTNQYNQAWNRSSADDPWNDWATLAGYGQTAKTQLATLGQNYVSNVGNTLSNQGQNQAQYATNQGNIWSNVVGNIANQGMAAWGQQQQINAMQQNPNSYQNSNDAQYNINNLDQYGQLNYGQTNSWH